MKSLATSTASANGSSRHRTLSLLRWGERLLTLVGFGLLVWCGWVIGQASVFQSQGKEYLARVSQVHRDADGRLPPPMNNSDLIGEIDIPRLGLSAIILKQPRRGTEFKARREAMLMKK